MGRLLPFTLPKRRQRGRARDASAVPPSADAVAAPGGTNAPGPTGAATLYDAKAERAARRARQGYDLIGAAGVLTTATTVLALSVAFLPACIALAFMARAARQPNGR
ncbi:hypothetical protein [Xanthobacter flavus]|uniref:hypothetical protein n=1 Tax=Xanthobacter flavus TaxID=281 RepID=UPI0037282BE1